MKAIRWPGGSAGRGQGMPLGPRTDRPDITASEIVEFCFCRRAWWLRRIRGIAAKTPKLQAGLATHARVGAAVARVFVLRRLIWAVIVVAGMIVVAVAIAELQH